MPDRENCIDQKPGMNVACHTADQPQQGQRMDITQRNVHHKGTIDQISSYFLHFYCLYHR